MLRRLDLQYNQIRSLHPKTSEKLSRLESPPGQQSLQALGPGHPGPLRKLRILYANGNEIGRLSRGSFEGLESLVKVTGRQRPGGAAGCRLCLLGKLALPTSGVQPDPLGKNASAQLGKLRFLNLSANELQPPYAMRPPAPLRSSPPSSSANNLQHLGRASSSTCRASAYFHSGQPAHDLAPEAFGVRGLRELRLEGNRLSQRFRGTAGTSA